MENGSIQHELDQAVRDTENAPIQHELDQGDRDNRLCAFYSCAIE